MWKCPGCGEKIEPQFDACWNCGASRDEDPAETPESADPKAEKDPVEANVNRAGGKGDAPPPPEEVLLQILHMQKYQRKALDRIRSQVGCLFTYMVFSIVVGILVALFSVMGRVKPAT
jgi:hypothetical protein